jgi:hypothetical protein
MKTTNEIKQFKDWSAKWDAGRKIIHAGKILKLWQQPMPRHWEREIWEGRLGYRKRSDNKGEKCIERILLKGGSNGFKLMFSDQEIIANYRVDGIYHNMPLANQRKGQVIADAFGILETGKSVRPLFIEVKVAANDPWFALVENLQQIRLARACAQKIQAFVHENTEYRVDRGVWGLILAPESYYENYSGNLAKCKLLLDALKQNTRARVAFGSSDSLASGQIKIITHNWLVKTDDGQ